MKKNSIIILLIALCINSIYAQNWTTIGDSINGEYVNDGNGAAVCISKDASTIAISATKNDNSANNAGYVRVFNWDGSNWAQLGNSILGEAALDFSGGKISMNYNGEIVAIGARTNDGNGNLSGHVRVYEYNGTNWVQQGGDIDGEFTTDYSGGAVSLDSIGNTVVIGAEENDGNGAGSGHVRVFDYNGSTWNLRGLDIDGDSIGDNFGSAVSMSADGNTFVASADENDKNGNNAGQTKVFNWNGTSWLQKGSDILGEASDDYSGKSVSISNDGNIIAISAHVNDGNGTSSGHVRVYSYTGSDWTQKGIDIDGKEAGDYSGISISMDAKGETIVIGSYFNSDVDTGSGQARVFEWANNSWKQRGQDINGTEADNHLGGSVCISADGYTIIIGEPRNSDFDTTAGQAKVYTYPTPINSIKVTDLINTLVYPNPVNSILTLEFADFINVNTVSILDLNGKTISVNKINSAIYKMDVSNLPKGYYLLKVIMNNKRSQVIKINKN